MINNIVNYYRKISDLGLTNIKNEKTFQFKAKLNNTVLLKASEQQLIKTWVAAGGGGLTKEARKKIEDYKTAIKKMHVLAVQDYNKTLKELKATDSKEEKQKILNRLADRGFQGFKGKNGVWNIETYSNMYFSSLNNDMIRLAVLESSKIDKYKVSSHNTKCGVCKLYEGRILTRKQIEEARGNGLFHPHCLHLITEV